MEGGGRRRGSRRGKRGVRRRMRGKELKFIHRVKCKRGEGLRWIGVTCFACSFMGESGGGGN